MASLAQTIKTNKGLAQVSSEELAARQGRAASTQPLETGVLGGTPDQAKMAGTPAQKAAALRTDIQGTEDLATVLRRGGAERTITGQEQQQLQEAEKLQQLGGLEERVQQLAEQRIQEATQVGTEADVALQVTSEDPEVQQWLEMLRDNDPANDIQALLELNHILGKTKSDEMLTTDEILDHFGGEAIEIGSKLTFDAIRTGDIDLPSLGFSDIEEVNSLLGQDVSQMTVSELVDKVNAVIEQEHSQVEDLKAQLSDPNVGAAERAQARQQLKELGALGIRSAESDLEKLADKIQTADVVEFDGDEVSVEELLGDEMMSGLIARYINDLDENGKPVSDWGQEFKKNHQEDLIPFITEHMDSLKAAAEDIDESVQSLAEINNFNSDIKNLSAGDAFSDDIMNFLFGGVDAEGNPTEYDDITGEKHDLSQYPALEILKATGVGTIDDAQRLALSQSVNDMFTKGEQFFKEFMTMDESQLRKLGAFDHASDEWNRFLDTVSENTTVDTLEPGKLNELARVFGLEDEADLRDVLSNLRVAMNAGLVDKTVADTIPGLREGNWHKVIDWMKGELPRTLDDIVNAPHNMKSLFTAISDKSSEATKIPENIRFAFVNDSVINEQEAQKISASVDYLGKANIMSKYADKLTDEAKETLQADFEKSFNVEFDKLIEPITGGLGFENFIDTITRGGIRDDPDAPIKEGTKMISDVRAQLANLDTDPNTSETLTAALPIVNAIIEQLDTVSVQAVAKELEDEVEEVQSDIKQIQGTESFQNMITSLTKVPSDFIFDEGLADILSELDTELDVNIPGFGDNKAADPDRVFSVPDDTQVSQTPANGEDGVIRMVDRDGYYYEYPVEATGTAMDWKKAGPVTSNNPNFKPMEMQELSDAVAKGTAAATKMMDEEEKRQHNEDVMARYTTKIEENAQKYKDAEKQSLDDAIIEAFRLAEEREAEEERLRQEKLKTPEEQKRLKDLFG